MMPLEVAGQVKAEVPSGAKVVLLRRSLGDLISEGMQAEVLAQGELDSANRYRIRLDEQQTQGEHADSAIYLELRAPSGEVLAESAPLLRADGQHRIDLWPTRAPRPLSEQERLLEVLGELDAGPQVLEQLDEQGLLDLSEWLDVDPELLYLQQTAQQSEANTGLSGAVFYALGSRGLPMEPAELLEVPLEELTTTLQEAVRDEVVAPELLDDLPSLLENLSEQIVERAMQDAGPSPVPRLSDVLATASVPSETVREVLRRYQRRQGSAAEFWESLTSDAEEEPLGQEVREELEVAVEVAGLVDFDLPLLRQLQTGRQAGRWKAVKDLAGFDFDDWCEFIEEAAGQDDGMEPYLVDLADSDEEDEDDSDEDADDWEEVSDDEDALDEDEVEDALDQDDPDEDAVDEVEADDWDEEESVQDDRDEDEYYADEDDADGDTEDEDADDTDEYADDEEDWIEARASAIMEALEEAYPSEFIYRELIATGELSPNAQRLLESTPDHDLTQHSIRERLGVDGVPGLGETADGGPDEAAIEEIEAVERISRVTQKPEQVVTLLGTGIRSAHSIAAMPRRHFTTMYGEALGGRAQASQVHAQAQQNAAASTLAMIRLLQALQQSPQVLSAGLTGPALGAPGTALKGVPDAQALFGSIGLCECKHCNSVYSPAAYLVDLLRYLDVRDPSRLENLQEKLRKRGYTTARIQRLVRFQPLDVLLARRPDLADIPLTCENTLTTLPYIDLVNELLEARVVGGNAAHDTGKTPADVLKAVPQHKEAAAYERLRQAVHPISMPFHEPLGVIRAYLGHLGVKRLELMKSFGRAESRGTPLLAEALGMSIEELGLVVTAPTEPYKHFGFEAPQSAQGKSHLEELAKAPRFLSAAGISFKELIALVSTRFINKDDSIKLVTPAPDCDPEKVRVAGLDAGKLSRMLQLMRLRPRLKWSIRELDRGLEVLGAETISAAVLQKLVDARELTQLLDRPIHELLGLWGPLDTFGEDNRFEQLFKTRAVAWRSEDTRTFELRPDRVELAHTGDKLDPVAPALLAAFRITSDELSLAQSIYQQRGTRLRLDLAGLSAIYRVALLSRALKLRVDQLEGLLRLVPPEADPFKGGEPGATLRFVKLVRQVQESEFSPETLVYLFRPLANARREPKPSDVQIAGVFKNLRQALSDALAQTAPPSQPTREILRQKLGMLLDAALLDQAMEVLNPESALPPVQRREFFQRHLALIFPKAEASGARLFAPLGGGQAIAAASSPPTSRVQDTNEEDEVTPDEGVGDFARYQDDFADDAWVEPAPELEFEQESDQPATSASASSQTQDHAARGASPGVAPGTSSGASASQNTENPELAARWQANIGLVLEHLLPYLRTRQIRGAVVQTLSDVLGTSSASTALLIETILRSRQFAGEPLLKDFLSLIGKGLTGAYFANDSLSGNPVHTRVDSNLQFSWAGSPAAPGVPGRGFSVRWTGRLLPKATATHTFFVETDGAVRITVKAGSKQLVVLEVQAASGRSTQHVSKPIKLDSQRLYEIQIEYRNAGAAASFNLQYGTSPNAKQPLPTAALYPADGLSSFAPIVLSYRRLHKASLLVAGFQMTDAHLKWLSADSELLDLDALPTEPDSSIDPIPFFQRWVQLAGLYALRKKLPHTDTDLFEVMRAAALPEALKRLVKATGWNPATLTALAGPEGLALGQSGLRFPSDPSQTPPLLTLEAAMQIQRRVGVGAQVLNNWANATPDVEVAGAVVQTVKARYNEKRWLEVAQALNDPLRRERRDALVAYLLPRMRSLGVTNRNQFFEFFLIDVDMNPCMLTSRIKQAISAVQTFFQRCLMNLEPQVNPRLVDNNDWKWLKNYRVWEANRKIFLYPENWIEPELRDDKSPLFKQLERTILQQEIKKEHVESAFLNYLQKLDEVSRLDVRAVWFEAPDRRGARRTASARKASAVWNRGTYHIFARTYNAPHVWFYRRLEKGRIWTPWEKIDADIEGDHLVPVMYLGRLHLFWTVFREQSKTMPMKKDSPPFTLGKDWEISLAYSVYERGHWTRKRLSKGVLDYLMLPIQPTPKGEGPRVEGSAWIPKSSYTLRARLRGNGLTVYVYRRRFDRMASALTRAPKSPGRLLSDSNVDIVAHFQLDGCNGELVEDRDGAARQFMINVGPTRSRTVRRKGLFGFFGGKRTIRAAARSGVRPAAQFRLNRGGQLNAPAGYRVDATGLVATNSRRALSLRSNSGAMGCVLQRAGWGPGRMLPVEGPQVAQGGLFPFFFQDLRRTYFVMPMDVWIGRRTLRIVARPLTGARAVRGVPRFGRRKLRRRAARKRGHRKHRRRESVEELAPQLLITAGESSLEAEQHDNWEDDQDDAWDEDNSAERRHRRRRRRRRTRPRRRVRRRKAGHARARHGRRRKQTTRRTVQPRVRTVVQAAHAEQRLRFVPFEQPSTCRFILALKERGLDGLLKLRTTRSSAVGIDHHVVNGRWVPRRQSLFSRMYRPGPLVDKQYPSLDVEFGADNPYALYNWELFFHAPLQVAVRLAKDGRHDEAQRWFHFIFDPTTDVSGPSPQRYWRFAPFNENTEYAGAQELMALLSYAGREPAIIKRQKQVKDQVSAWWEKPFSPHVIARLRTAAYQKAVVMKYIDNLIEWGDKLFRKDTMESIQEATQLYILASNIMGRRAERVPRMVEPPPVTFRAVRGKLDPFANWVVRFENSQVRRPFQVTAQPDVGGVASVLGMATQYFCIPPNPKMDKHWDTVVDRLYKIRNCMNIKGVVRQLALFEPPIDPGMLVRAAAAGVDLGSVLSSLNAPPPHHRFRVLLERALHLAKEVQSFGRSTLEVLERKDAESLAALRAANESRLQEAARDIRKLKVKQIEEELARHAAMREGISAGIQYYEGLLAQPMTPQAQAGQQSLSEAQAIGLVAEGVDLVSKILYAIPDFQAGGSGAFGSPYATATLGGQMLGDISEAFATSLGNVMASLHTEANMAQEMAKIAAQRAEWEHLKAQLEAEKEKVEKQINEISLKLEIGNAELRRYDTAVENSKKVEARLREMFTSEELYGWMLGELSGVYFQAYKLAFDSAKLAERAHQFELGDSSSQFVRFAYWDSLKKGLLAGDRLLVDLRRLETAQMEGEARALEVTRHISLRQDAPLVLEQLRGSGQAQLDVTESLLDGDFPGHYFRRIKTVGVSLLAPVAPLTNVNCTLTLLKNQLRKDSNASGAYAHAQDAEDPRFVTDLTPVQAVAVSRPNADHGVFKLEFNEDRYLPFEGAGAISTWRIELRQSENALDLSQVRDVVISIAYTARNGGAPLEAVARASRHKALSRGELKPALQYRISLRWDTPSIWKQLRDAGAGKKVEVQLPLSAARLSGRLRGFDVRVERVAVYAQVGRSVSSDALSVQLAPPKGAGAQVATWVPAWPGSHSLRGVAEASGAIGAWKATIGAKASSVPALFDDVVLLFELRARKA